MDRLSIVRYFFSRAQRGLEIGPSFNPIAPKADGWLVETIDHAPKEELIAKYTPLGLDVSKIETVDWVWRGGSLEELIGAQGFGRYDYFIASHVIEHIPDLLGFLQSVEKLLIEGGILSLVVPDKRHCFDFFKPLTSTADILYSHELKRQRHTKKTMFEEIAYASRRGGSEIWDASQSGDLTLSNSLDFAMQRFREYDESTNVPYQDSHCSFFVPASFELMIEELAALGVLNFEVARTFPGAGCEFYIALRKAAVPNITTLTSAEREERRLALMKQAVREIAAEAIVD